MEQQISVLVSVSVSPSLSLSLKFSKLKNYSYERYYTHFFLPQFTSGDKYWDLLSARVYMHMCGHKCGTEALHYKFWANSRKPN